MKDHLFLFFHIYFKNKHCLRENTQLLHELEISTVRVQYKKLTSNFCSQQQYMLRNNN